MTMILAEEKRLSLKPLKQTKASVQKHVVAPVQPITVNQLYIVSSKNSFINPDTIIFNAPGRQDVLPHPIQFPFDWGGGGYQDRNWCSQLHMWRMMDAYLVKYEKTRSNAWLRMPVMIVQDWYKYIVHDKGVAPFAWKDMVVGIRAMKLAYLLSLSESGQVKFGPYFLKICRVLVLMHLDFLLDEADVSYSNHTFFDLHGAMALAQIVHKNDRIRILDYIDQVFPKLLAEQFSLSGVQTENSPGYHQFAIKCLKRLQATGWFHGVGIDKFIDKAEHVNTWVQMPDGRIAAIGDTDGAPWDKQGKPVQSSGQNNIFHDSGYAIIRETRSDHSCGASYLFFMGAFNSRFHKHSDDLSFIWFEGEDILCDCGKLEYKAGKRRQYAQSTRAHNTVEIDGINSGENFSATPELCYGSAVKSVTRQAGGYLIESCVIQKKFPVVHSRFLYYRPDQCVLVIDLLDGEVEHKYTQWFHFAPHLDVTASAETGYISTLASGRPLRVLSTVDAESQLGAVLIKGQQEPVMQGWISQSYAKLTPNYALGFSTKGNTAIMATLFVLDDMGSTLFVKSEKHVSLSLKAKNGNQRVDFSCQYSMCVVTE